MEEEISGLREEITRFKADEKVLRGNLNALCSTSSVSDLRSTLAALASEKERLLTRLGPLRSGNVSTVSTAESLAVDKSWKDWSSHANARRKICMNIWGEIVEALPEGKTKEELWVSIGLRTPMQTTNLNRKSLEWRTTSSAGKGGWGIWLGRWRSVCFANSRQPLFA